MLSLIENNIDFQIFLFSMLPVIELRGTIPYFIITTDIHWLKIVVIALFSNIIIGLLIRYILGPIFLYIEEYSNTFTKAFNCSKKMFIRNKVELKILMKLAPSFLRKMSFLGIVLSIALSFIVRLSSLIINPILKRTNTKLEKISRYKIFGLILFIGIPLPITGVWTGSLASFLLSMDRNTALVGIILGSVLSAIIVTTVTFISLDLAAMLIPAFLEK